MKAKVVQEPTAPEDLSTFEISGSFIPSLLSTTFMAYAARGNINSFNPAISSMTGLNLSLKGLLAISPLIPNVVYPIPMFWRIHKTGGKKIVVLMVGISIAGMITLTTISMITDISTIKHFDWRYGALLSSGILIGHGAAAFQLMIDALKWSPKKNYIPKIQTAYSFIVDSASVTTPIIIFYLKSFGFALPFSLFTSLLMLGESGILGFFFPSPYNQYKTKFPGQRAKELAQEAGELESSIGDYDNLTLFELLKNNISILCDRRILLLSCSLFASLGNAWVTRLILPNILTHGYGMNPSEAVITASLSFLLAICSRPVANLITQKWDEKSGGVLVHLLGCVLTMIGGVALTMPLPHWGLYLSLGAFNIGYGFNMITPLNIAVAWSKPNNGNLKEVNPSSLFSIFSSFGALGGIILPLILGLMVDAGYSNAYQNYFYIIVFTMALSAICIPIVDYQVRKHQTEHIAKNPASFFGAKNLVKGTDVEADSVEATPPAFQGGPVELVAPQVTEVPRSPNPEKPTYLEMFV